MHYWSLTSPRVLLMLQLHIIKPSSADRSANINCHWLRLPFCGH